MDGFAGVCGVIDIILADDHEIVRRGLRALLETRSDFLVRAEAADGHEAVALALKHKPDVAVIDVSLPRLGGVETTRQIRNGSPNTEVLIFTMHDSSELINEILDAGARGYLLKSDGDELIVEAITALARHRPFFAGRSSQLLLDRFKAGQAAPSVLTAREREIVQLIAEGQSNKRIAIALDISVKTVETHRAAAMRKLGIHTTAELVRYALRNKLIEP